MKKNPFCKLLFLVIVCFLSWLPIQSQANSSDLSTELASAGNRIMIFVSDLHMGVGIEPGVGTRIDPSKPERWDNVKNFKWHNTEDFRWHKEFKDFLTQINKDGESNVDLVLVGDILELWQSLDKKTCDYDKIDKIRGMDITITTSAKNNEEGHALLSAFNFPFKKKV